MTSTIPDRTIGSTVDLCIGKSPMVPVDQVTLQRDQDARARERLQTVVRIARNREVPHSCEDNGGSFTCFWGIGLLLGTLELFLPFPFWARLLVWRPGAHSTHKLHRHPR